MAAHNREHGSPQLTMNSEVLTGVFYLYASALFNYALRLCNDPIVADNAVGDTFAQLIEQVSAGAGPNGNTRSYLFQTTYHLIVDHGRNKGHQAPLELLERQGANFTAEQAETNLMMELLSGKMREVLTDDQQHVIILRFLEDFSLKETAEIMGKEVNNIKVIQNRAIARLRRAFGVVPTELAETV